MNTISSNVTVAPRSTAPTIASPSPTPTPYGGGDELALMRPSMDAAAAVGRPTDAAGAATIMGTASGYLQGAAATLVRIDEGIAQRTRRLEVLDRSDPAAAASAREQLDLLQRLRDRIQLSMERVSDIVSGRDRDDLGTGGDAGGDDRPTRRVDDLVTLQERRQLLAPAFGAAPTASPEAVASAYAQGAQGG